LLFAADCLKAASCFILFVNMKKLLVSDLTSMRDGDSVEGLFLVLEKQQRTGKTGSAYLAIRLADKSGDVEGRIWSPADPEIKEFEKGEIVKIRGAYCPFNDKPQLKVDKARVAKADEIDKADYLPTTTYDVAVLWAELEGFVASFTEPHLKLLVETLIHDERIGGKYREAPAAKQLHHAWLGGLLEHVVSLLKLADRVVGNYPMLNRDLVLTGVILHDIGKTQELAWESGFEYTVEGVLLGHIQMGYELAAKTMDTLPDFPPRLRTLVLHLILSHHGKLEFGSPKLPMIPEALALSFLDDFDAKMMAVQQEFEKCAREGKAADEMTGKVWALDQRQLLSTKGWLGQK
jgi:3'-5' exoribonuclease